MPHHPFTLHDFIAQMAQVNRLGGVKTVMRMIPGMTDMMKQYRMKEADIEAQMRGFKAMYLSMTPAERNDPQSINHPRRQRIARGAGVTANDVTSFLKQFDQATSMMNTVSGPARLLRRTRRHPAKVLALVTPNPRSRDPSAIHNPSPHWHVFRQTLLLLTLAALSAIAFTKVLQWLAPQRPTRTIYCPRTTVRTRQSLLATETRAPPPSASPRGTNSNTQ